MCRLQRDGPYAQKLHAPKPLHNFVVRPVRIKFYFLIQSGCVHASRRRRSARSAQSAAAATRASHRSRRTFSLKYQFSAHRVKSGRNQKPWSRSTVPPPSRTSRSITGLTRGRNTQAAPRQAVPFHQRLMGAYRQMSTQAQGRVRPKRTAGRVGMGNQSAPS